MGSGRLVGVPRPHRLRWRRFLRAPAVDLASYPLCAYALRLAAPSRDHAVLDVGCGPGLPEYALAGDVARLVAVDRSCEAIEAIADALGGEGVEPRVADATAPIPESLAGAFDRVLCVDVLEHVDEPQRLLEFVAGALKPDGLAVMTFPVDDPTHGRLLPRGEVARMIEALGLSCELRFVDPHVPWRLRPFLALRRRLPLPATDRFEETVAHRLQPSRRSGRRARAAYGALRLAVVGVAWSCGDFLREARDAAESRRGVLLIRGRRPAAAS